MIKEVIMFTVVCDGCGADASTGTEYSCWSDKETSEDVAMNDEDWHKGDTKANEGNDGQHFCPNCFMFDDNDVFILKAERKQDEM